MLSSVFAVSGDDLKHLQMFPEGADVHHPQVGLGLQGCVRTAALIDWLFTSLNAACQRTRMLRPSLMTSRWSPARAQNFSPTPANDYYCY